MGQTELEKLLREAYDKGRREGTVAEQMHLFGIKHEPALNGWTQAEHSALCGRAGIPPSLGMEIRKGARLAKYVKLKDDH